MSNASFSGTAYPAVHAVLYSTSMLLCQTQRKEFFFTQTFARLRTGGRVSLCGNRWLAKSLWPTQPTSVHTVVWT